ncbi:MAG: N-acetylmannosamine-6-phosphate 2-epimerase [Alicyclobacillaceae bacterium]|nr:N-acetylmannosamine-6-phosphate 2-epimerase [Alicyclobacillaceae bacterium]
MDAVWQRLNGGLVVSCQAQSGDPLYGTEFMVAMARSAKLGGASGMRVSADDLPAVRAATSLPTIGLQKRRYGDCAVWITPTIAEVDSLVAAGADVIALDATNRRRPGGLSLERLVSQIRAKYGDVPLLADVATCEEALSAERLGFDAVATTLFGYTEEAAGEWPPSVLGLVQQLVDRLRIPVLAEGRLRRPEQAAECLAAGAFAVVVGSAITRPQEITNWFVESMRCSSLEASHSREGGIGHELHGR